MINEPYHHLSVHIYSSKKDVCITLLIVSESNQGQPDDTTSAGGVWQGNEIWSFIAATFVAELNKSSYFFCLCYYIVTSGEDRQQSILYSVPFYYYGMYVYVG